MRLERLASPGAPKPGLFVAPALMIAANLGVMIGQSSVEPEQQSHAISARSHRAPGPAAKLARAEPAPAAGAVDFELTADRPKLSPMSLVRAALPQAEPVPPATPPAVPDALPAPEPVPAPEESPAPELVPSIQPLPADSVWRTLALCESGGNWQTDSGNGYFGGLQFSLPSWQAVGGTGYPHEHPRDLQIQMAERLQARQGWEAWPNCARRLGLT